MTNDKIKWVCDICGIQIGWIKSNGYRYGFAFDSFAVEDDTGKELCSECFRKTPEGKERMKNLIQLDGGHCPR